LRKQYSIEARILGKFRRQVPVETGRRAKEVEHRVRHANGALRWQASIRIIDASGAKYVITFRA